MPSMAELEKIITHYWRCNAEEATLLEAQLRQLPIVQAVSREDGNIVAAYPNEVYFENEKLLQFFDKETSVLWLPLETLYSDLIAVLGKKKVSSILAKIYSIGRHFRGSRKERVDAAKNARS